MSRPCRTLPHQRHLAWKVRRAGRNDARRACDNAAQRTCAADARRRPSAIPHHARPQAGGGDRPRPLACGRTPGEPHQRAPRRGRPRLSAERPRCPCKEMRRPGRDLRMRPVPGPHRGGHLCPPHRAAGHGLVEPGRAAARRQAEAVQAGRSAARAMTPRDAAPILPLDMSRATSAAGAPSTRSAQNSGPARSSG
jgi:hypothetical protein